MTPDPSVFSPQLWSKHLFYEGNDFWLGATLLSPTDMWNGKDPGPYDEACAFAAMVGVTVAVPASQRAKRYFRLVHGGWPPLSIAQCGPAKLIEHIKAYASKYNSVEDPE